MATRKPTPKATVTSKAKPAARATMPASQPTLMHERGDCCSHHHGGLFGCLCCCPVGRILFTRSFWAASVVAFIVIFATNWFLHARFLAPEYAATAALWRTPADMQLHLLITAEALTAMAYAAIILGMGHAGKWWGSWATGKLAACPLAISALTSYATIPFASPYIPTVWAVASIIQGGLVGLAICAALKVSRAPEATCCATKPTLH